MSKMTIDRRIIKKMILEEISRVAGKKDVYFHKQDLSRYFRGCERLNGLFYAYHLLNNEKELAECYQTGLRNSHGFK